VALFVISGIPASGKSTIARLLANRLDRAVYVPGDTIRAMVINGRADANADAGAGQLEDLLLRYQGMLAIAKVYLNDGFDVIVEDVIIGQMVRQFLPLVPVPEMHLVFLDPSGDAVAERDRERTKTAYGVQWNVRQLRDVLHMETARIGLWLDTSELTADQTVEHILKDLKASKVIVSRPSSPAVPRRRRFGPPR
jgi:chloramphenicol 3-O-phosphotransferase